MKKNSIFKLLFICFFAVILFSCFIKTSVLSGSSIKLGDVNSIGILGFPQVLLDALIKNIDKLILVLSIGAMYGVLNRIDAYKKMITDIAKKFVGKEKILLVIFIIIFAIISSLLGIGVEIFVFIPFVSQILYRLGYDKKTVFASTFGSILIGILGATFNSSILGNINNYFSVGYTSQLLIKSFIFVIVLFLFVTHVVKRAVIENAFENSEIVTSSSKIPVVIYMVITFVLVMLSNFKFGNVEGFSIFTTISENLNNLDLSKNIFGLIPVFGKLGNINIAFIVFISSLIISFIYSLKIDDSIDGMFEGASFVFPSSIVLLFALAIPEICTSYSFYLTIIEGIVSHFSNFNIFISSCVVFVTSIFVPTIDGVNGVLPVLMSMTSPDSDVLALIVQTIYGLSLFIIPTSSILLFGLSYNKLSYIDWVKYIFKLFLYVLVILLAIFLILFLI